jgi:hypothetical protein
MLRQETDRSSISPPRAGSPAGENGFTDDSIDDAWIHNLVAGWMKKYFDPLLESDEAELILLFQGQMIERFDEAFDRRIEELTLEGKLPVLEPDEMYPTEFIPILGQAFEDAEAEVGWCPMHQANSRARK